MNFTCPLDGDNLRHRVFCRMLTKAGGLRRIRLHDLRHSFATMLIQNGESLAYVRPQSATPRFSSLWTPTAVWYRGKQAGG